MNCRAKGLNKVLPEVKRITDMAAKRIQDGLTHLASRILRQPGRQTRALQKPFTGDRYRIGKPQKPLHPVRRNNLGIFILRECIRATTEHPCRLRLGKTELLANSQNVRRRQPLETITFGNGLRAGIRNNPLIVARFIRGCNALTTTVAHRMQQSTDDKFVSVNLGLAFAVMFNKFADTA